MRFTLTPTERLSYVLERFWLCTVRQQHQQKMDSHGRCYRCGKAVQ